MDTNTTNDPAATLAAIIREVDGRHDLSADALACAILAHPDSQWANFRDWFKTRYDSNYLGGISLCDVIHWVKHLPQQSPQPATPWPQLPPQPPGSPSRGENPYWTDGFATGWHADRAELQRLREQAGVAPTPAPTFPEISDQLIRWLIRCVLDESGTVTEAACMNRLYNPVPLVRERLIEVLQAAERPAS